MTSPHSASSVPASRAFASRHATPLALLFALCVLRWAGVLFTGRVLLPGDMLRGFAPFGGDPQAPWDILRWDSLGQYYPWRVFAAREFGAGRIPLWNPHQFAGAPFLANAQSAVFYPLNLPFWIFDPARAFALSAVLHSLLACMGAYWLTQRWGLSRAASLLTAIAFGFCGYLSAWTALPTLADTAAWLPLLLVLLERAADKPVAPRVLTLGAAIGCAMLAGHAQVFFYCLIALALRACFLNRRAWGSLALSGIYALLLGSIQLLPTLELARLGHRAAESATTAGWQTFLQPRALQGSELPSLFVPGWPMLWGSFSENFGYMGVGIIVLAFCGSVVSLPALFHRVSNHTPKQASHVREDAKPKALLPDALASGSRCWFALLLTLFGLLYATGTPLAEAFYFGVPGISQMGGVGRALILWSFGAALLAAFGLDALRRRVASPILPAVALLLVLGELFGYGLLNTPSAPRASIYPSTALTDWLHAHSGTEQHPNRVLFVTPRGGWLRAEDLQEVGHRNHPPGVLPPNGAILYGLFDVNGYDSLTPRAYRDFVTTGQGHPIAPDANGNMLLLQDDALPLDALNVRYIVTPQPGDSCPATLGTSPQVAQLSGACVYARPPSHAAPQKNGHDFYPGMRDGQYQPTTFRLGGFLTLCALGLAALLLTAKRKNPGKPNVLITKIDIA